MFPSVGSVERLMGAVLMEENGWWATKRKLYYKPACEKFDERREALAGIALAQKQTRLAA